MSLRFEDYSLQYDMLCGLVDSNISEEPAASIFVLEQHDIMWFGSHKHFGGTCLLHLWNVDACVLYQTMAWHARRM